MANPPCRHPHLHFEAGGLYIVCKDCKYVWAAVGNCSMRIVQDVMARGMGLTELDRRSDPYAQAGIASVALPSGSGGNSSK